MLTDHIEADEQQAFLAQRRADLGGDPAITVGQRPCFTPSASRQVAAGLAGRRNTRQAVGHGLAVDHQDAFVTVLDRRQIGLAHGLLRTVDGQGFEDHREVRIAWAVTEDRGAAHAVQRLEDHIAMLGHELAQHIRAAADHRGRRALREQRGEQLLVAIAQALWTVDHQHTLALGLFEQVGGVDEFEIEGRVLAHQDDVEVGQRCVGFGVELEPFFRVGEHFQGAHPRAGLAVALIEVLDLHVEQLPAALLGGEQHGQRAVLLVGDLGDRVHDNSEANAHG